MYTILSKPFFVVKKKQCTIFILNLNSFYGFKLIGFKMYTDFTKGIMLRYRYFFLNFKTIFYTNLYKVIQRNVCLKLLDAFFRYSTATMHVIPFI